eukprot:2204250-Rhodomonas_salina.3
MRLCRVGSVLDCRSLLSSTTPSAAVLYHHYQAWPVVPRHGCHRCLSTKLLPKTVLPGPPPLRWHDPSHPDWHPPIVGPPTQIALPIRKRASTANLTQALPVVLQFDFHDAAASQAAYDHRVIADQSFASGT